ARTKRKNTKLRRFAGVSAAGARSRNPERSERPDTESADAKTTTRPRKNTKRTGELSEVEAVCGRERSGSPQPKSRACRGTSNPIDESTETNSSKPKRKNTKRTGEFSEAAFLTKATSLGFKVAKPWGDSERYDFIVACAAEPPEFFWRVQI